jgi:acyl-CoA thioester hydrolase
MADEPGKGAEHGVETYRGAVYPWETDVYGHMNVRYYVSKFDDATWQFKAMLGYDPAKIADRGTGFMAVGQDIAYKKELVPGDTVHVWTDMLEVGEKKLRFRHRMYHTLTQELVAEMVLTAIHVTLAERRSAPMPPTVRAKAESYLAPEEMGE